MDYAAYPSTEGGLELTGIDQSEQTSEGVVRRNTVNSEQIAAQPILFLLGPQLDLDKVVSPCQDRVDHYNQQFDKVKPNLPGLPRIVNRNKYFRQMQLAFRLHDASTKTEEQPPTDEKYLLISPPSEFAFSSRDCPAVSAFSLRRRGARMMGCLR